MRVETNYAVGLELLLVLWKLREIMKRLHAAPRTLCFGSYVLTIRRDANQIAVLDLAISVQFLLSCPCFAMLPLVKKLNRLFASDVIRPNVSLPLNLAVSVQFSLHEADMAWLRQLSFSSGRSGKEIFSYL